MAKRLNKRQQRELEEAELLKAQEEESALEQAGEAENDETVEAQSGPVNAFAALNAGNEQGEEDEEASEEQIEDAAPKKSRKKKNKKKQKPVVPAVIEGEDKDTNEVSDSAHVLAPLKPSKARTGNGQAKTDDLEGMDEVDRALAELDLKYGPQSTAKDTSVPSTSAGPSRQFMAWRNLLSVDPTNLDPDAELRRFFGSKVIASDPAKGSRSHRAGPSSKLRYTISKPKPTYPPPTSLAGLTMREYTEDEVNDMYRRRQTEPMDKGEKWFSFEHHGQWRGVQRQFLGAVQSHDPNQLMALLRVYPWHVDTLLQMSEVYRLQSDIGAASDFAERALYAFDRCLMPSFSVTSGSSRLDFDRVENRAMFTALHRIISYLGRRGCWVTAFNFAKLLYALDPHEDPHGAAFWLDFLAVKSGNGEWLLSILQQGMEANSAAAVLSAYPGMAYAGALAVRAKEAEAKQKDHSESDAALRQAMQTFPQVIPLLANKIGASIPDSARSHSLLQIEAGYSDAPENTAHLLSHIYVSRSEALWKDPSILPWFERVVPSVIPALDSPEAASLRAGAAAILSDLYDTTSNVPLNICRHVVCSESTSFLGFLPPKIRNAPVHSFDPLPPRTATSVYDEAYFAGLRTSQSRDYTPGGVFGGPMNAGFFRGLLDRIQRGMGQVPEDQREGLEQLRRAVAGLPDDGEVDLDAMWATAAGDGQEEERMPGGFPDQDG